METHTGAQWGHKTIDQIQERPTRNKHTATYIQLFVMPDTLIFSALLVV